MHLLGLYSADQVDPKRVSNDVCCSSKDVKEGELFFAIPGTAADGTDFIPDAISKGAVGAVVAEDKVEKARSLIGPDRKIPLFAARDIRKAYAMGAAIHRDYPTRLIKTIGVTGTNGKTSVSWLLAQLFSAAGERAALMGTLGMFLPEENGELSLFTEGDRTTSDARAVQDFARRAVEAGAKVLVMEATAHGIDQHRVAGVAFDACVFTNVSRDHLDYFGSMEVYGEAKRTLFRRELAQSCKAGRAAAVNIADPVGRSIFQDVRGIDGVQAVSFSAVADRPATVSLEESQLSDKESRLTLTVAGSHVSLASKLIGGYNVENTLATVACAYGCGISPQTIRDIWPTLKPVPGRLERVESRRRNIFIDYAHTPDALLSVQKSLREVLAGRLVTVFGCGGDRDRGKRPLMGKAVADISDFAIVTSDNPRTENPRAIIDDILPGVAEAREDGTKVEIHVEADRKKALEFAIEKTTENDIILVAGKGHESYQEISGVKYPFSDLECCKQILSARGLL